MLELLRDIGIKNTFWQHTILVIGILLVAYILSETTRRVLNRFVQPLLAGLMTDATKFNFFKNAASFTIYTFAVVQIFYTIPHLRSIGITIFAGAGILAAIVGFASQQALSNIISGIFIVIFKPFRVGDAIKLTAEHFGTVEDITLRHVVLNGPENRRIIIPNSVISAQTIINSTWRAEKICVFVDVIISHESPLLLAIDTLQTVAEAHPDCLDERSETDKQTGVPRVRVRVIALTEAGVSLRAAVWAKDAGTAYSLKCDVLQSVKLHFAEAGIQFPNPSPLPPNRI